MTDNTKMRDPFAIKEGARNCAMDEYFKARPQLMRTRHEECLFEAGFDRAWQAEQSVPVVGEVLFFASDSTETADSQIRYDVCAYQKDYSFFPVYRKPAHSITAAELDALRKDAERWRVVKQYGYAMEEAIDAAIAADREK